MNRIVRLAWACIACAFCMSTWAQIEYTYAHNQPVTEEKEWTFLIYMAADNDLYQFAWRNLAQAAEIGSNANINILVHLDIKTPGKPKVTKRLLLEKNKIVQVAPDACMDSGDEETFTSAVLWAHKNYPSRRFALVLWNHGFGDLNPVLRRIANPAHLFHYNARTSLIELDRSIPFMEYNQLSTEKETDKECTRKSPWIDTNKEPRSNTVLSFFKQKTTRTTLAQAMLRQERIEKNECQRGICFDETNYNYLDDNKLLRSFARILRERKGKKIDFVIFDACLMAGTGTASLASTFAEYMVASEEVVLGPGYNYKLTLAPFAKEPLENEEIAKQVVAGYLATYGKLTEDYTQSALALSNFARLNDNINQLATALIEGLKNQKKLSVTAAIRACRNRHICTFFDEPSYIDLFDFYTNLLKRVSNIQLTDTLATEHYRQQLISILTSGLELSKEVVIANVCGKNLANAHGISIYFPEYRTNNPHHNSYQYTHFAQSNNWVLFLKKYLG